MTKEELLQHLSGYANKVNTGVATTADHGAVKNAIQAAYDAGSIPQELKSDLGKKATFSFKNMFSSKGLSDLPQKIAEKGGNIGKFAEEAAPSFGKVAHTAEELGSMGKKMRSFGPLLGMLGAGGLALGAGQKAMAGDVPGAAGDVADFATDYIPGIAQAKMALRPSELGREPAVQKPIMTQSPKNNAAYSGDQLASNLNFPDVNKLTAAQPDADPAVNDSSIAKPNPTRYADLINQIGGAGSPDSLKEALKKKQEEE